MEQTLFIFLFLTGIVPFVLPVPRKYYLIQVGETWSDAQAYCRAKHTDLATIGDEDNLVQLQKEAQHQNFISIAWIGLYSKNIWHWTLDKTLLGSTTWWDVASTEPNDAWGKEACGVLLQNTWRDANCLNGAAAICYDDRLTGTDRYVFYPVFTSWFEVQRICRQNHTDMASARDQTEYSTILGKIISWTWFGLSRNLWSWSDQSNFSSIAWIPGQPDCYFGHEYCIYINNGQAGDAVCTDKNPFFCYRDITGQKQMLRFKVQSNGDMNNPTAAMELLQKIQQKLTEHGMIKDIKIKWNHQTDNAVFHMMQPVK